MINWGNRFNFRRFDSLYNWIPDFASLTYDVT